MDGSQQEENASTELPATEAGLEQMQDESFEDASTAHPVQPNGAPRTFSASSAVNQSPDPSSSSQQIHAAVHTPLRSQLPFPPSFLRSLASLPPLSPAAPSHASLAPASSAASPAAATDSTYITCACQPDSSQSYTLSTPRKRQLPSSASSPTIPTHSTSPVLQQPAPSIRTVSQSDAPSKPSPPSSVTAILDCIAEAQSAAIDPPPPSPFSSQSVEQVVDYLESLCCHLSSTHITLYRYVQHARHAQLLQRDDRLLSLLHGKNAGIVDRLKTLAADETQLKQRMSENGALIATGRKTQALSLSSLPSFMQTEKRRTDAVNAARVQSKTDETRVQLLASEKLRLQQQLLALGGLVTQLGGGKGGEGAVEYAAVEEALRSESMRALLSEEEVEEGCKRMRDMREWSGQEQMAAAKMNQVALVEREMRDRLDELIVLHWVR